MINESRNKLILAMRGKKSMGLIARELGITRGVVAGVFFRTDWPIEVRVASPRSKGGNQIGHGPRKDAWKNRAAQTLPFGRYVDGEFVGAGQ